MRKIQELVEMVDEELCGAKTYAEKYLELRAFNDTAFASKFKTMAYDELNHAMTLHDYAIEQIQSLNRVYTAPQKMQEKWDKSHAKYVEKTAWIRQMLDM